MLITRYAKKRDQLALRAEKKAKNLQLREEKKAWTLFRKLFKGKIIRPLPAKVKLQKSIEYESTQCSTQDSDSEEEEPTKSLKYEFTEDDSETDDENILPSFKMEIP